MHPITENICVLLDVLAQEQIPDTQTIEELETIIGHAENHLSMYKEIKRVEENDPVA